MNPWEESRQRACELLASRAVFGLSNQEDSELERFLQDHPDTDRDMMDRVAARCDLALGIEVNERLPDGLRERIRADAETMLERELR
jgi:hypothetical protein